MQITRLAKIDNWATISGAKPKEWMSVRIESATEWQSSSMKRNTDNDTDLAFVRAYSLAFSFLYFPFFCVASLDFCFLVLLRLFCCPFNFKHRLCSVHLEAVIFWFLKRRSFEWDQVKHLDRSWFVELSYQRNTFDQQNKLHSINW